MDNDIRPPRPLKVTIRGTTVYNTDYEDPRSKAAWQARDHEAALKSRADAINAKAEEVKTRLGIITEIDTADENEEAWMMIEAGGVSSTAEAEQAEANRAAKAAKAKAEEDAAAAASSSSVEAMRKPRRMQPLLPAAAAAVGATIATVGCQRPTAQCGKGGGGTTFTQLTKAGPPSTQRRAEKRKKPKERRHKQLEQERKLSTRTRLWTTPVLSTIRLAQQLELERKLKMKTKKWKRLS